MKSSLENKISHLLISETKTITEALRQMDAVDRKLLLVLDDNKQYRSLLSVGDIQRHLIKNQNFDAKIGQVLGRTLRIANTSKTTAEIRSEMLQFRMEFMPILDEKGQLSDVILWEDLFKEKHSKIQGSLKLPVVIMAGGKGTRLQPITNIIPKPLIPIGNKTIVEHIIERFMNAGCSRFYFTVNYKADMIQNHFDGIDNKNYEVFYFKEDQPTGTAGSLSLLKDEITSPFFVSNCDILVDQDYSEMYTYHKDNNNELTLIGALKNHPIPYGTLQLNEQGLLHKINEKPDINYLVNAGLYLIEPHLLQEIPEDSFFHITHLIEKILERKGRIGVFPVSEASWMDIGNWTEYNETLKKLGEIPFI